MIVKIFFLILLSEIGNTAGQIFFKKGTNRLPPPRLTNFSSCRNFIKDLLRMPVLWLGFGSMALGLLIWLMALAQADLSLVFPLGSMQYLLILVASRIFLGEKIDRMKLAGTCLVVAGIIFVLS